MKFPGFILKAAGALVALMGVAALVLVAAPLVHGQSQRRTPQVELLTHTFGGSYIGVAVRDADRTDAERARLPQPTGAVVDEVRTDSPAAQAGLRAGDVITRFDGERVRSARHFERLVSETPEGREVEMSVARAGETVTLKVAPEASPTAMALDRSLRSLRGLRDLEVRVPELHEFRIPEVSVPRFDLYVSPQAFTMRSRLGVGIQELTDQLGEYFGAADGGLLVTSVDEDTPAKAAGLRAGDVITKVNGEPVTSAAELRRRLDRAEIEVTIAILRDRREQTVKVNLERRAPARRIIR